MHTDVVKISDAFSLALGSLHSDLGVCAEITALNSLLLHFLEVLSVQ